MILHFQIGPDNQITSPQGPEDSKLLELAKALGISQSLIDANSDKLQLASRLFDYQSLLDRCQEINRPPEIAMATPQTDNFSANNYNVPAAEKINRQIRDSA